MAEMQDGLRAALAVSALSAEDRRWLESRLSEDERGRLVLALSQLDERPLAEQAEAMGSSSGMALQSEQKQLAGRIGGLAAAVAAEPAWLQAAIGHALGAELRGRVLSFMDQNEAWGAKAAELRRSWASGSARQASALSAALLAGLVESSAFSSAAEATVPPQASEPLSAWSGLRAWLKKAIA
ncbi:hypothetical protein B0T37_21835 [Chromobacterium violaceum]|uniref:hypothetical protein n=1 Tax=Chromobacterium violaceum TaxID=536 RepID=UPI0009DA4EAA|nr:hypothetical protein [Chromobacterium violaceum]OQS08097.1 hypothetical protein B0T38_21845 [Chromobacterium violaceum]OQS20217.1 hypothetical protein B0T37_21835 [Chromobacterium violaceum]